MIEKHPFIFRNFLNILFGHPKLIQSSHGMNRWVNWMISLSLFRSKFLKFGLFNWWHFGSDFEAPRFLEKRGIPYIFGCSCSGCWYSTWKSICWIGAVIEWIFIRTVLSLEKYRVFLPLLQYWFQALWFEVGNRSSFVEKIHASISLITRADGISIGELKVFGYFFLELISSVFLRYPLEIIVEGIFSLHLYAILLELLIWL